MTDERSTKNHAEGWEYYIIPDGEWIKHGPSDGSVNLVKIPEGATHIDLSYTSLPCFYRRVLFG